MFDDARLDSAEALEAADGDLRRLAEAGARVRLETGAGAEAIEALDPAMTPRAVVAAGADSRLLRAVLEPSSPVPFVAWPGPGLPGWAGALDLVVVLAAAGGDAQTASAVSEAVRRGCMLITATPPRSLLAETAAGRHSTVLPTQTDDALAVAVLMLQALHRLGVGPDVDPEGVARALDDVAVACSPHHDIANNPAKDLAMAMADSLPLVWGGSVLAARAARRVVEAMRRVTGRAALSADADHLMPVLAAAQTRNLFADPYDDDVAARPALLVLDDGAEAPSVREQRGRLAVTAEQHGVRVQAIRCADGSETARYAALLSNGLYAAAYLGIGLRGDDRGAGTGR